MRNVVTRTATKRTARWGTRESGVVATNNTYNELEDTLKDISAPSGFKVISSVLTETRMQGQRDIPVVLKELNLAERRSKAKSASNGW